MTCVKLFCDVFLDFWDFFCEWLAFRSLRLYFAQFSSEWSRTTSFNEKPVCACYSSIGFHFLLGVWKSWHWEVEKNLCLPRYLLCDKRCLYFSCVWFGWFRMLSVVHVVLLGQCSSEPFFLLSLAVGDRHSCYSCPVVLTSEQKSERNFLANV